MYGKPTGKNNLGDICVDGRIILQDRRCTRMYNVTLRGFRATVVAGDKQ